MTQAMQKAVTNMRRLAIGMAFAGQALMSQAVAQQIDDKPARGVVQMWVGGVDNVQAIIDEFEKANPDVDVVITSIPDSSLNAKVLAAIAANSLPDILRLPFVNQLTDISSGSFDPVPDGLVEYAKFTKGAVDAGKFDGSVYAVPWTVSVPALVYRKDLAEAAGVTAPKTWEELEAFCKALKSKGAAFGLGISVGYDIYTGANLRDHIMQAGGDVVNADHSAWTVNSPQAVKALDFFYDDMVKAALVSPDGPQFLDITPWFSRGKVGSMLMGVWFRNWLEEANGKDWVKIHVAAAPFPAGPGGNASTTLSGNGLLVPKMSKNKDAAWKLARYLTEVKPQVLAYQKAGLLPAVNEAWSDPTFAGDDYLAAFSEALKQASAPIAVPTWGEVAEVLGRATEYVARGDITAQEALDDAQKRAERIGLGAK